MGINQSATEYNNLPVLDAVASMAGTHVGTTGAKFDQIDPNAQVGAIENAVETGAAKIGQIQEMREAVAIKAQSANDASFTDPGKGAPSGMTGQIMRAGAMLGLGFVAPPLAAAAAVVEGVKWAVSPVNQGVYEHAALVQGKSEFKEYSSSSKKEPDPATSYTDTAGDTYANGLKANTPAPKLQQRPDMAQNPYMEAAGRAVSGRSRQQLEKEMGGVQVAEQKLLDQVNAGKEAARDNFGVDSPAMKLQTKPMFGFSKGPGFFG